MKNIGFIFFILLLTSCKDTNQQIEIEQLKAELKEANSDSTQFIHTVFFWLKKDANAEDVLRFEKEGMEKLLTIKSIDKGYYGPPAMTPREVVDNSYDLALVCHFKNSAAHDAYQEDPIHLAMIDEYKHLWERVQVYDNLVK